MAYYQNYTFTTANQALQDLAAFAAANGWTIDFSGAYNTSYWRVHLHQGEAHFDFYSANATTFYMYGCTDYNSGLAPDLQPGASGIKSYIYAVGKNYWFVAVAGAIYTAHIDGSNGFNWGMFGTISAKIGSWTGGACAQANSAANLLEISAYTAANGYAQLYYNGAWSAHNTAANGFCGSANTSDLPTKQPVVSNGGIIPIPVAVYVRNTTDSSKRHPMGYAPGLYRVSGGDIYSPGDIITIGGDEYIIFPRYGAAIGYSAYGDFIFKLGA